MMVSLVNSRTTTHIIKFGYISSLIDLVYGVPQSTVLDQLLFLLHNNDLPSLVSSKVRIFADECLIFRNIKNKQDQMKMQEDLHFLVNWGITWGMRFNAAKCNHIKSLLFKYWVGIL